LEGRADPHARTRPDMGVHGSRRLTRARVSRSCGGCRGLSRAGWTPQEPVAQHDAEMPPSPRISRACRPSRVPDTEAPAVAHAELLARALPRLSAQCACLTRAPPCAFAAGPCLPADAGVDWTEGREQEPSEPRQGGGGTAGKGQVPATRRPPPAARRPPPRARTPGALRSLGRRALLKGRPSLGALGLQARAERCGRPVGIRPWAM
jgi:hypothetical protein